MGLGLDLPAFIGQLVSFVILVLVLRRFGYAPIRRILDERAARIRASIEEAEDSRRESERIRAEAELELQRARQEAHSIVAEAGRTRDRFLKEARTEAERESATIVAEARARIEEERRAMIEDLRRRFVDGALSAAESIISRHLNLDDHRKLIVQALDEHLPGEGKAEYP